MPVDRVESKVEGVEIRCFPPHKLIIIHNAEHKNQLTGMRWHPMMVRWCLYLRHQSNKAYSTLRDSGIALPSERTLRDYTHFCKAQTGFSSEVDHQLILASKVLSCEKWKNYVVILVDEMYIRYSNIINYCDLMQVQKINFIEKI